MSFDKQKYYQWEKNFTNNYSEKDTCSKVLLLKKMYSESDQSEKSKYCDEYHFRYCRKITRTTISHSDR